MLIKFKVQEHWFLSIFVLINHLYALLCGTGHVDHITSVINEMEENKFSINSNIVSCLMRVYCSNGDIAGAVNAYYQTYHLASPKKSVLRSLLDRCVASRDRINAELGKALFDTLYFLYSCFTLCYINVSDECIVTFWSTSWLCQNIISICTFASWRAR